MESIIQQFSNLDFSPVFHNLFTAVTQPFIHSFQSLAPAFLPEMKSLIVNEPGLIGGTIFVLITFSFATLIQHLKNERVTVTNRKPSAIYREGFPSA